jgi:predicted Zn finger-like uncharacterized protein
VSLATRCTHCSTVFRVVQDQLKISEGWVRCGRCSEVFNALEGLFDLDREGPISAPTPLRPVPAPPGLPTPAIPPAPPPQHEEEAPEAQQDDAADEAFEAPAAQAGDPGDTRIEAREDDGSYQPLPFEKASDFDDEANPDTHAQFEMALDDDGVADAVGAETLGLQQETIDAVRTEAVPGFVRQAERAANWQRPRVRASLAVAAVLLGGVLTGQWVMHQRDALAAQWPQAAPAMTWVCQVVGCTIEPLRRVEALAVDSSGLTRIEGSTLYRLQLVLRNRDTVILMTPAFDLTLTDARSDVLARRVMTVRDFTPTGQERLAPGAELQLTAVLDLGERRVAGYAIELFYP